MSGDTSILRPGRNCERIEPAQRVAWLVDAERYFDVLASAIERARRSVLMVGWDFHSRVRLRRDGQRDEELVTLLERAVRSQRRLHVRMLGWDFAMIYALEREFLPLERFERRTHRRIHFRLDGRHPPGASHHQKIVVIDDAIAFCGGLDVTVCRWDTRDHEPADPRREDPGFSSYGPFHDVQVLVDGAAARALGGIARARWHRATGQRLRERPTRHDPWPDVEPDLRDVEVGIARTQPEWGGQPEVRHVENLYVDAIRAARRSIYIENQYFTSFAVRDALAERLAGDDAPEVAIVLPRTLSGWLEKRTMGALMTRAIEQLREADRHGRLRAYVPVLPEGAALTVHAKVMVVDDRLARVGSANLSNRSMGLDTECDLAVESSPDHDASRGITSFRDALLAEHLGTTAEQVRNAIRAHGSLLRGIDALCVGERRLEPFDCGVAEFDGEMLPGRAIFDPERPIPFDELRSQFIGFGDLLDAQEPSTRGRTLAGLAAAVAIPVALLALWKLTPVAGWVTPETLSHVATFLDDGIAGRLIGLVLFVVAALLLVPVVSLIVAAALVFGFVEGALLALAGSTAAAAAGWGLGRVLWRDTVRKLSGERLDRLNHQLSQRGLVATAMVRVVPVAPFAVVNLVAGASRMRLRDFVAGTAIGMAPGTAALAFLGERAAAAVRDPSIGSVAATLAGAALVVAVAVLAQRLIGRMESAGEKPS